MTICAGCLVSVPRTIIQAMTQDNGPHTTAVKVSMQSIKGSDVKYRESDSAYSFQSCEKRLWDIAMF